jgi:hypothetical protein
MIKGLKLVRNTFFCINAGSCLFLMIAAINFPDLLIATIGDTLGITIHIATMAAIFFSTFMMAIFHQLYEQEKMEQNRNRW